MRLQECELSVQLLHGGIAPWSKPTAGIQEYSANTNSYGTPIRIYRISTVYQPYINRISTVVDSGEIGECYS